MNEQTEDTFEVSPQQEQLWLAGQGGPAGRLQAVLTLSGTADPAAIRAALRRSVARHEILRTTFVAKPGIRVPFQAVAGELDPVWSEHDLSGADDDDPAAVSAAELAAPLSFTDGPLLRAALVTRGPDRRELMLTVSSLCADPASMVLLAGELATSLGVAGTLAEDPLQYADFAAWQRELQAGDDAEVASAGEFWSGVGDLHAPELPFTAATAEPATAPGRVPVRIDVDLSSRLQAAAARYGADAATAIQAAWYAALARSCGEQSVTAVLLGGERRHADLDGALGNFSSPVPVSLRIGPRTTAAELVSALRQAGEQAKIWQDYVPAGTAQLPIGFVSTAALHARAGALSLDLSPVLVAGSGLRLWLTCAGQGAALEISIDHDPAFIDGAAVERLARRLERLLVGIADDLGVAIGELELVGDEERQLLLGRFGDGGPAAPAATVHGLIAARAVAAPDRTAVADEHGSLTYAELATRTAQLANRLRRAGVNAGGTVGLCTDRSVDMVVGLLGILQAGAAYVPLHFEHPPARLALQLAGAGADVIVTQEPLLPRLVECKAEFVCLDRDRAELDGEEASSPDADAGPEDLAYVIYTSGSTGTPKGVGVTHGNVTNYAAAIIDRLGARDQPLSFATATSISTDLGNTSVFGALCSGGTLVLLSPVAAADAAQFARQARANPIDVLKITPSHLAALSAGGDASVFPRRWLVIGGERGPWDLLARVRQLADCRVLNHYGPTEATIGATTYEPSDGPGPYRPVTVPIGKPLAGDRAYVLDANRRLVPIGAPGRLHLGGAGVARGYIGAPELTRERFLPDPFAGAEGARMYDTGDIARWLPDGVLEFLGRVDEQVKIRGYRVEPAEVETALRTHAAVREAVVLARASAAGDMKLVAYCTLEQAVSEADLAEHLARWLPEYMLPSAIVTLDALPMTPSGKVDRLALPDPEETDGDHANQVAPRTPVERALAEIWAQVLGVETVGVHDDFFALGGHSLLATQVVAQVRTDFALELPLHSLFTYPTIEALAAEVVSMMSDSEGDETAKLMAELEGLTDEEADRLLAGEPPADA
jgi:amino acid adenylation domain-containing protein